MAKQPNKVIGIDIGSSSIKLVEISKTGKGFVIDNAVIQQIDDNVWKDGMPIEADVAAMNLQKGLRALGSSLKTAALSVPTAAAMMRVIPMESSLKGEELWATIEANLSQYLPFSAEEVQLDFQKMGPTTGVKGHENILVVAVQKEFVNARDLCSEVAGLKMGMMDVDIYALLNLIRLMEPMNTYMELDAIGIVDVGLSRTGLHVLLGDGSVYVREQPLGGERLTEIISEIAGIPMEQAEMKKINGGWDTDPVLGQARESFFNELSEQIASAIQVYLPNNPRVSLKKIILTGGGGNVPGLDRALMQFLQREVVVLDPANLLGISNKCRLARNNMRSLAVACGLAMRTYL